MIDEAAWLAERRLGIGGSDAAAVFNLSPWMTPLELYLDKRGELPTPKRTRDEMEWGHRLEPVVRQAYADRTGQRVIANEPAFVHPQYPFMRCNLDGRIADSRKIYEGKIARFSDDWGEEGTDQVPIQYSFQAHHNMAVCDADVCDFGVLIGGSEFRIYTVEADLELRDMIITGEAAFWDRIQNGEPPEPVNTSDALLLWGRKSKSRKVQAGAAAIETAYKLRLTQRHLAAISEEEEDLKLALMAEMMDSDTLVDRLGNTIATWRTGKAREGQVPRRVFKLRGGNLQ